MKKIVAFVIPALLLIAAAIFAVRFKAAPASGGDIVLQVNGQPVVRDEYALFLTRNRSAVTTYFRLHYNAADQKNYWTTAFDGNKPINMLKERATSDCVRSKVELELARSNGLIGDTSYAYLQKQCKSKNQAIQTALGSKKTVCGITRYDMDQFYNSMTENLMNQLKEKLSQGSLKVTVGEISDYYRKNIAKFTSPHKWTVAECYIPYGGNKDQAYRFALTAKKDSEAGKSFEAICQEYAQNGKETQRVLFETNAKGITANSALIRAVAMLHEGEISGVTDTGDGYAVLKLVRDEKNAALELPNLEPQIRQAVLKQKFENMIDLKVRNAKITYDAENYDSITIN